MPAAVGHFIWEEDDLLREEIVRPLECEVITFVARSGEADVLGSKVMGELCYVPGRTPR